MASRTALTKMVGTLSRTVTAFSKMGRTSTQRKAGATQTSNALLRSHASRIEGT
jgi:hypothetical protein